MLLFVIALLVAGGVIAYVGDRLGTYIGKKRLSAWGLRPRHTAMLYTVVSGGLIAVLTLFTLIGYDRAVQRALLYGPQILQENQRLIRQDQQERAQVHRHDVEAAQATARAAAALLDAGQAETRLGAARRALQQSQTVLQTRQKQLLAARGQLTILHTSFQTAQSSLHNAQSRLASALGEYEQARENVKVAQGQYVKELDTVNHIVIQGAALARQGKLLAMRNADLTQANSALDNKNQELLTQTTFLQGAHLIYHKGQEIGRSVIPTNLSVTETRRLLGMFLTTLSERTQQAGAVSGDNGLAVRVLAGGHVEPVTETEALAALAQSIASEPDNAPGVVVVASAAYNAFGGEQTPVELQPYDNVLVYAQGAFIAETPIDGSLPENQILNALGDFLKQRVQPDARSRGIIPRPDPETGEPTVGEPTDDAATYALVKQIQRIGPHAMVTARAAADTYSSGPLRLNLTATTATPIPPAAPPGVSPVSADHP